MKNFVAAAGVAAIAGMASAGAAYSADLGVLTSLDVCSDLGLVGLALSSETNCLQISGEIEYSFTWGDYDTDREVVDDLAYAGSYDIFIGDGRQDWESTVETLLTFSATAPSDFGAARGVITLEGTDEVVVEDRILDDETHEIVLDEAYLSIGDRTVLTVGLADTIANTAHDTAFTFQEMFNEDEASGVGFNSDKTDTDIDTAGHVIQVSHDLENGFKVSAALEDFDDRGILVGVIEYGDDTVDAHVTMLADEILAGTLEDWAVHSGVTLSLDNLRIRGAGAFNNDGWWNVLGTGEVELDIFTLAVAGEATSSREYGFAGSVAAKLSDSVLLNVGSRAFVEADGQLTVDTAMEAEFEASEAITLVAGGGYVYESDATVGLTYGALALEWNPSRDFEAEVSGRVHSRPGRDLGYELNLTATRSFD